MKSVERHPNQGKHIDLSDSLRRGARVASLHKKKELELHKSLIGEDRSKDVDDKQVKLMNKKASVQEWLDATQIKREDTDAYLRYLTRWHDHHEAQYNPKFPVKFANTRADKDLEMDMEKVAVLGGIARMAGRGAALGSRAVSGASNFAGNQARRFADMRQSGSSGVSALRRRVGEGISSVKRNAVENYNMGRYGNKMSPSQFQANVLKNNPNLAGVKKTIGGPSLANAAPKTVAAPTINPAKTVAGVAQGAGSKGPALKGLVDSAAPHVNKAKQFARENLDYAKGLYNNASPGVQRGAKIGAGVIGAYGAYKAGRAAYNRFEDARYNYR